MPDNVTIGVSTIDPDNMVFFTDSLVNPPTGPNLSVEQARDLEIASFLQACSLFGPSVPTEEAVRAEIARRQV